MNDQANRLRALARTQPAAPSLFGSRVVAIASGKGGVGKTNVVAGLAMTLSQQGQRVMVLDADFGLANLDILLGLTPQWTLEHVLRGEKLLEEIILEGPFGIRIIPASSGIQELTRLDAAAELRLVQGLQRVSQGVDWLLIDTAAGIHDSVIKLLMAAQEVLLVTTPEPTALVDAYAMVKVVHLRDPRKPFWLLINNAQNEEEAEETIDQLQAATRRFLDRELQILGMLPADPFMLQAVRQQRCVVDLYPQAPASLAFASAAARLQQKIPLQKEGFAAFWKGLSTEEP